MTRSKRPSRLLLSVALLASVACSSKEAGDGGSGGASQAGQAQGGSAPGGSSNGGTAGSATPTGGTGNAPPTGGSSGTEAGGAAGTGAGDGGTSAGGASGDAGTTSGGAGSASGGTSGAGALGGAGNAGMSGSAGQSSGALTVTPADGLWTGVRYYTGSTPSNRTSGPAEGPTQMYRVHNGATTAASVTVAISGTDAARFQITAPASFPAEIPPNSDLDVTLRLVTASTTLGTAPAQDDGATVLEATLTATAGSASARSRLYALVLTYVELEPTFGQILDAFPEYTSNLPNAIRNDANPNPPSLPGVEAGTDEVRAPVFRRANTSQPVKMWPIGRFSPAGLVPFGSYPPGDVAARVTAGTLGQATDRHTNDKSRMLLPPVMSGSTSFTPATTTFGIFMQPAGVGVLATEDAEGFDGAHRIKVWTLRDSAGTVRPNQFLLGGEEAANGDYQDYVFILENVEPMP